MNAPDSRFSRIFAVVDPTQFVQTAYLRAEMIARKNGAHLTAYCCVPDENNDASTETTEQRVKVVRESIERLVSYPDDQLSIEVESASDWRRQLVDTALESGADLIVKTASRHSLVGRVFNTTTDWLLLREAKQPVLLVTDRELRDSPQRVLAAIKRVPEDKAHEELNERIIDLSHRIADAAGFEVHGATAYKGEDMYFDRQKFADYCKLPRNRVHAVEGAPYTAIARAATDAQADTIVIGNPEKSETAQRLIDHVDADIIVLPHSA